MKIKEYLQRPAQGVMKKTVDFSPPEIQEMQNDLSSLEQELSAVRSKLSLTEKALSAAEAEGKEQSRKSSSLESELAQVKGRFSSLQGLFSKDSEGNSWLRFEMEGKKSNYFHIEAESIREIVSDEAGHVVEINGESVRGAVKFSELMSAISRIRSKKQSGELEALLHGIANQIED